MSHPFKGSPTLPFNVSSETKSTPQRDVHHDLASLPTPRKHYKWYYSTRDANSEMAASNGLHEFLRGYFYLKSADWIGNSPRPLEAWTAEELAKMPLYYIMPLDSGMRDSVEKELDSGVNESLRWLSDAELEVYVQEYGRTGFQGGLNWYRVQTDPARLRDLDMFAGKKIEVPCLFVAGEKDWGTYQEPGVIEKMGDCCTKFQGVILIEEAGHWVQQEQPEQTLQAILKFIR